MCYNNPAVTARPIKKSFYVNIYIKYILNICLFIYVFSLTFYLLMDQELWWSFQLVLLV